MTRTRRLKQVILQILDAHRVMTIATNRPDGWPQATIVGYVNDGLLLYCFISRNTQKHGNILRDRRVSIAIGHDASQPLAIKGLSLAGTANPVTDQMEFDRVAELRLKRYPEYAALPVPVFRGDDLARIAPRPAPDGVVLLRIEPVIFSVVDYSKGFGHSDLIAFSERDLDVYVAGVRHRWDGAGETATNGE